MYFKYLKKFYGINRLKNTSLKKEVLSGITTFFSISYLFLLIPKLLKYAGMDYGSTFTSLILASIFATLLMSLFAKKPFALAPSFALTTYFTYSIVISKGVPWQIALGALFIAGIIYIIIASSKLREIIFNGIPPIFKKAIGAGIGLFLILMGLKLSRVLIPHHKFFLIFGDIFAHDGMLTILSILILSLLIVKKVKWAFLWTCLIATTLSLFTGNTTLPTDIFKFPDLIIPTSLRLDIIGALSKPGLIFSFLIVLFFTTLAIFLGLSMNNTTHKKKNQKDIKSTFLADSLGCTLSTLFGAPFVSLRAENIIGLKEGGKTGLTSLIVVLLLIITLFFSPLIKIIPISAISAILIMSGIKMASLIKGLKKRDYSNNIPAYATMLLIPISFSIPHGIALGFILYILSKLFSRRLKEVNTSTYIISLIFLIFLIL